MKEGFHRVELHKTVWEVPEKYKNLAGIGSGAYGQVITSNTTLSICYQLSMNENQYAKLVKHKSLSHVNVSEVAE